MSDREKLLRAVADIRRLLSENELVGMIVLAGRGGMMENHLCFDAPWFKVMWENHDELMGLRLMSTKDDPPDDLPDTLGALRGMAELSGLNSLTILHASDMFDAETGAEHTPLRRG